MLTQTHLNCAIQLAVNYHWDQVDKQGQPYIFHLLRVMLRFDDLEHQIVAVLHDVIEDTNCTLKALDTILPAEIVVAVVALTKTEGEDYEDYLQKVCSHPIAKAVKRADIWDNLSRVQYLDDEATRLRLHKKYIHALKVIDA